MKKSILFSILVMAQQGICQVYSQSSAKTATPDKSQIVSAQDPVVLKALPENQSLSKIKLGIKTDVSVLDAKKKDLIERLRGGVDAGGGDEIALDFQQAFYSAVADIKKTSPNLYAKVSQLDLTATATNATILVVEDALNLDVKDVIQKSVAVNIPDHNVILINRARWKNITNKKLRNGIALHEFLSLKKIEQTGFYPISSLYVGSENKSFELSVSVDRLQQISVIENETDPYRILKKFFDEANEPVSLSQIDLLGKKCSMATRAGSGDFITGELKDRSLKTIKINKKYHGPLFSGSPSGIETRVALAWPGGVLHESWFTYFDDTKLNIVRNQIMQTGDENNLKIDNDVVPDRLIIRKNSNKLVFEAQFSLTVYEKIGQDLKSKPGFYYTVGYCY